MLFHRSLVNINRYNLLFMIVNIYTIARYRFEKLAEDVTLFKRFFFMKHTYLYSLYCVRSVSLEPCSFRENILNKSYTYERIYLGTWFTTVI